MSSAAPDFATEALLRVVAGHFPILGILIHALTQSLPALPPLLPAKGMPRSHFAREQCCLGDDATETLKLPKCGPRELFAGIAPSHMFARCGAVSQRLSLEWDLQVSWRAVRALCWRIDIESQGYAPSEPLAN